MFQDLFLFCTIRLDMRNMSHQCIRHCRLLQKIYRLKNKSDKYLNLSQKETCQNQAFAANICRVHRILFSDWRVSNSTLCEGRFVYIKSLSQWNWAISVILVWKLFYFPKLISHRTCLRISFHDHCKAMRISTTILVDQEQFYHLNDTNICCFPNYYKFVMSCIDNW